MGNMTVYIDQFGYIVLLISLLLEMIAVPLPGEILMSYTGFLVFQGHLNWIESILMAGIGASIGMTISYWLGYKLGTPFFEKYGHWIHMGPERIEKTSRWFSQHGNKLLFIAYFIPGVRHITGYFTGITRLPFRKFAILAYSGAFLWVGTFITIGKLLGPKWNQLHSMIAKYLVIGCVVGAVLLVAFYLYKKNRSKVKNVGIKLMNLTKDVLRSINRFEIMMTLTTMLTLGLILLMMGMIQELPELGVCINC